MNTLNMVGFAAFPVRCALLATARFGGGPQVFNFPCSSPNSEVILAPDSTYGIFVSGQGGLDNSVANAPQEKWSRGCRAPCVSFWLWLLLALPSQLAHKSKPKKWSMLSRSPLSRSTPANTSKNFGRTLALGLGSGPFAALCGSAGALARWFGCGQRLLKRDAFGHKARQFASNSVKRIKAAGIPRPMAAMAISNRKGSCHD